MRGETGSREFPGEDVTEDDGEGLSMKAESNADGDGEKERKSDEPIYMNVCVKPEKEKVRWRPMHRGTERILAWDTLHTLILHILTLSVKILISSILPSPFFHSILLTACLSAVQLSLKISIMSHRYSSTPLVAVSWRCNSKNTPSPHTNPSYSNTPKQPKPWWKSWSIVFFFPILKFNLSRHLLPFLSEKQH